MQTVWRTGVMLLVLASLPAPATLHASPDHPVETSGARAPVSGPRPHTVPEPAALVLFAIVALLGAAVAPRLRVFASRAEPCQFPVRTL